MPMYRFYTIGPNGHISRPPETAECPDDLSAIKEARKLTNGHDIEVWEGTRVVTYLVPESFKTRN